MRQFKAWFTAVMVVVFFAGCGSGGGGGSNNPAPVLSAAKAIVTYSLAGVAGTINETAKTIAVAMPYGTDVTALVATFTTTGAGVKVGTTVQISGTTANDFTSPVSYTVTAADSSTTTYIVTVTVALSSAKAITAYSLAGVTGTINETAKTISVTMPYGTDVTALVATFSTTGAGVKVGAAVQTSGTTANDFTSPVAYTVTAADSSTTTYTITVTVALSSAKAITAYSLAGVTGTINETAKTIAVAMPYGTDVTALVATFSTTGASVKVGTTVQTSGTTANDFTSPVAYTVTAADSSTTTYTITVTVAARAGVLPKTGQSASYATGDDGNLQKGVAWPSPMFTTNGDTTVTDNLTGLVWTADSNAPGPAACSPGATKTWQGALDYVACLNANSYLGHTDWRLPNRDELKSLANYGQSNTGTWLNGQGFSNAVNANYWSSTIYVNVTWTVYAWTVGIDGSVGASNGTSLLFVWPVRAGQSGGTIALPKTGQTTCYDANGTAIACIGTGQDGDLQKGVAWPSPRFTTNADTTVTDNLTGLVWTSDGDAPGPAACGPAGAKTWQGALTYAACLNSNSYFGHTDWRLPNSNELESLVNPEQSNTATWLNTQGFSNVQALYYWSSTTNAYNTTLGWIVDIGYGGVYGYPKTDTYTVWPVRGQ